jgi:hypothetical protein
MPQYSEDEITAKFERINDLHQRMLKRTDDENAFLHAYHRRRQLLGLERGDHSTELASLTAELQSLAVEVA